MLPVLLQVSAAFQVPTRQAFWGQNSSCERNYSLNTRNSYQGKVNPGAPSSLLPSQSHLNKTTSSKQQTNTTGASSAFPMRVLETKRVLEIHPLPAAAKIDPVLDGTRTAGQSEPRMVASHKAVLGSQKLLAEAPASRLELFWYLQYLRRQLIHRSLPCLLHVLPTPPRPLRAVCSC